MADDRSARNKRILVARISPVHVTIAMVVSVILLGGTTGLACHTYAKPSIFGLLATLAVVAVLIVWVCVIPRFPVRLTVFSEGIEVRRLFSSQWIPRTEIGKIAGKAERHAATRICDQYVQVLSTSGRPLLSFLESYFGSTGGRIMAALASTFRRASEEENE